MSGVDLYVVSELLGHSSVEVTKRYGHLSPRHKKKAVEILSKILPGMDTFIDTSTLPLESHKADVAQLVEQRFRKPKKGKKKGGKKIDEKPKSA
jgi:hypothetical protein